jgi:hypothetical protein
VSSSLLKKCYKYAIKKKSRLHSALAQSLFIQIIEPKQKSSRLEKVSIVKITNEKEQSRNQNNHQNSSLL